MPEFVPRKLTIPHVRINAEYPGTASITITVLEELLLRKQVITETELVKVYRAGIERGDIRHYNWAGRHA